MTDTTEQVQPTPPLNPAPQSPSASVEKYRIDAETQTARKAHEIEREKIALEREKIAQARQHSSFTARNAIFTTLIAMVGGIAGALVTSMGNVAISSADTEKALELQFRQQQFDFVVQATKGVERDIALRNLSFFVDAGILIDKEGKIRILVERGEIPGNAPNMNVSPSGLTFLKRFLELSLVRVHLGDGTEMIGYNHWILSPFVTLEDSRVLDLSRGQITEADAEALLRHDLTDVEDAINHRVLVRLTQNQFDALVSFVANIGPAAFAHSTVLDMINNGKMDQVPDELRNWVHVNNSVDPTLTERRELEAQLWAHRPQ